MAGSAVRVMGQKGLEVASLLPRPIRSRIGGRRLDWEDGAEAAVAVARPGIARLIIGPTNFAGQGYEWARAADLLPGVSAVNLERTGGNGVGGFATDYGVDPRVNDFSATWARRQERALRGFTHVLIEAGIPLFSAARREMLTSHVRRLQGMGLEVGLIWHGSDVRLPGLHASLEEFSPFLDEDFARPAYRTTAWAHRAADTLGVPEFVSTPDLLEFRPRATWLPTVVSAEEYSPSPEPPRPHRPVVVHAPSYAPIKGTTFIRAAGEKLAAEGIIDYVEVSGVTRAEVKELVRTSDIVVDSLTVGPYGVASIETMLLERVAVANVWESARNHITGATGLTSPVVQANPLTIEDVLRGLALDPERRATLGKQGRTFASEVHSRSYAAQVLAPFLGA